MHNSADIKVIFGKVAVFESKHMYEMAAALHPRFKLDWCFTDFTDVHRVTLHLKD